MKPIARQPFSTKPQKIWYRVCAICLSLYLSFALWLCRSGLFSSAKETAIAAFLFVLIAGGSFALLRFLSLRPMPFSVLRERNKLSAFVFLGSASLSLVILGIYLAADYPGAVSVDSAVQWTQAATHTYSNWHPVFHTLLLRIGYLIRPNYGFVVALQCGLFSLAAGYLVAVLHAWGIKLWPLLLMQALLTASPIIGNTMMYLWKDNAMTIGVTLLFAQAVNVYFSRGTWLRRWPAAVAFGLALAFTTMVRHNAFFFTVPLLFAVLLCYRSQIKTILLSTAVLVACLALVWGPLYDALDVTYPGNTLEESIGIPMTIICDIRKVNEDALDTETKAFTDEMADDEGWESYRLHVYNSIKFGATRAVIAHSTLSDILRMAVSAAREDPRTAFLAVCGVTDLVWGLADEGDALIDAGNSLDLPSVPVLDETMNRIGETIKSVIIAPFSVFPFRYYFGNIGVSFVLMLVAALWAIRQNGTSALMLALPVLVYNLGTMLLLCGKDARFFSFSPLVCTFALYVLLRKLPACREDNP